MSEEHFQQIITLLGLSRQRDGVGLTRALIELIGRQFADVEVAVLEVYGRRRAASEHTLGRTGDLVVRRFDDSGVRRDEIQPLPELAEVLRTLQPVVIEYDESGTGRLMIPIEGEIGPLRLVSIDGIAADPFVRARAIQIVEVYGNLIGLMDSRERDALTGLLNRQTFVRLFEVARDALIGDPEMSFTLAIADIDHFKRVNDTFGHLYGDEVLIHFARLMERSFRYTDSLFRFGGEEFVLLLSRHQSEIGGTILERFRQVVDGHEFPGVGHITVSIGYVDCVGRVLPTTLLDRADKALYAAKAGGRNRVVDFASVDAEVEEESGGVDLF